MVFIFRLFRLRVRWVARNCTGREVVKYGDSPKQLTKTSAASCATFTRDEMCAEPANSTGWFDPGIASQ